MEPASGETPVGSPMRFSLKWEAHERYVQTLAGDRGEHLLAAGKLDELAERACMVVSKDLNLLSPFENMAFRDGLSGDAVRRSGSSGPC